MKVQGIHHVTAICRDMDRTTEFYTNALGMRLVKQTVNYDDPHTKHFYFGDEQGRPGTVITFFEYPHAGAGRVGAGSTHHIAFMVEDEAEQDLFQAHLQAGGIHVNGPFDRTYFRSIYFRDPDGHILEIATRGPGFAVDEPEDRLGTRMILPTTAKTRDLSQHELDSDERT
jgi:glyoxalase family protein